MPFYPNQLKLLLNIIIFFCKLLKTNVNNYNIIKKMITTSISIVNIIIHKQNEKLNIHKFTYIYFNKVINEQKY